MENTQQNYMKSLGKKMGIMFYHITLDVNGEERKFLLEKELFEKLQGKSEININIKKRLSWNLLWCRYARIGGKMKKVLIIFTFICLYKK